MNINFQESLDFLINFLNQSNTDKKQFKIFQEICDTFIESHILTSQFPGKIKLQLSISSILLRMHIFDIFPELIGKKIICIVGYQWNKKSYLKCIPEIHLHETPLRVFNTSGQGMEILAEKLNHILYSLSGKDSPAGNLFSAVVKQKNDVSPYTAYIVLRKDCSSETTFFKEFLEVADEIFLSSESSEIQDKAIDYLKTYRNDVLVWTETERKDISFLRLKKGKPVQASEKTPFTSFSFLFQWALQPLRIWIDKEEGELDKLEKLLTYDLVTVESEELEGELKRIRGDVKVKLNKLQTFKKEYLKFRREILRMSDNVDANLFSKGISSCPTIDNWSRAEDLLLWLSVSEGQYSLELQEHIDRLREGGYPYAPILDATEVAVRPEKPLKSCELANIDRPIAHRLCIRLRDKLGISDKDAGLIHAEAVFRESADEHYVHGMAFLKIDNQKAKSSLRKALRLGKREAGKILYEELSKEQDKNDSDNKKATNFLLNALVPEMCFEKAMERGYDSLHNAFLLYISAAQGYLPAIREVVSLKTKQSFSTTFSDKEQSTHRKQAIVLYEYLQRVDTLDSKEYCQLGMLYFGEKRFKDALNSLKKSSDSIAFRLLGCMYCYGHGVAIDYSEATKYYKIAIQKGDIEAKDLLKELEEKEKASSNQAKIKSNNDYRSTKHSSTPTTTSSGCFLTTATCRVMGYGDKCEVLQAYRRYRDEILAKDEDGPGLIQQYYEVAPEILKRIDALPNPMKVYTAMWNEYLRPGYQLLQEKRHAEAKALYVDLVSRLMMRFLSKS